MNAASAGTSPMTPSSVAGASQLTPSSVAGASQLTPSSVAGASQLTPSSVAGASQWIARSSAPPLFDADEWIIRDYADLTPPARRKRAHGGPHVATPWLPRLRKRVALGEGREWGREFSIASQTRCVRQPAQTRLRLGASPVTRSSGGRGRCRAARENNIISSRTCICNLVASCHHVLYGMTLMDIRRLARLCVFMRRVWVRK